MEGRRIEGIKRRKIPLQTIYVFHKEKQKDDDKIVLEKEASNLESFTSFS
jgi:hypothetical protein